MKQFFKMMFASTLGVLCAVGIILTMGLFFTISVIASMDSTSAYTPNANTVFKIKLSGGLTDNAVSNPINILLGDTEEVISLNELLESIQKAKEHKNVSGIYIESGYLSSGSASLEAIRRALIDFKESGKFVVSYADNYDQGNYYVCSVADKVFMNPQGVLAIAGMASQTMFVKGLLGKLGIEMQVFKVGTYKGAVEPFMLDKLSDANREQIQSYVTSIWDNITRGIADSRQLSQADINRFANEGLFFSNPEKAIEYKFVDELKYKPEAEEYVKELAGQTGNELRTASIKEIKNIPSVEAKGNRIAVLYAEGEITSESNSPYEADQRITENVAKELIKLKNDDEVKAVVFRINSPGGSSYVSEQIWRQVVELKKVKPIVVSMSNVAASGGYYIACAANKIIAEANTLTGSIGVFGVFPNASGLMGKLALTTDVVKSNTFSDLPDLSRPMSESEKALLQSYVERTYQVFLTRCAEGRGMTTEAIDAIAQGRVWTGSQAKKNGLVDELGGLDTAIQTAAELAELTQYSVTNVSGSKDFFKEFIEKQLGEIKMSVVKSVLGDEFEFYSTLKRFKSASGIQARIPYDMKAL